MYKLFSLLVGLLLFALNAVAAVNVNTANKTELTSLPGIGPAKAQAIIDYRTKNGPFKSVDDLTKVNGIGPVILGRIRSDVALDGPTTVKPAANSTAAKPAATPARSQQRLRRQPRQLQRVPLPWPAVPSASPRLLHLPAAPTARPNRNRRNRQR